MYQMRGTVGKWRIQVLFQKSSEVIHKLFHKAASKMGQIPFVMSATLYSISFTRLKRNVQEPS